jgi:hypothetical protein
MLYPLLTYPDCKERRKLERKLVKLQARLDKLSSDASVEDRQQLLDDIEKTKGDILYVKVLLLFRFASYTDRPRHVQHFPTGKKYISLLSKERSLDPKASERRDKYRSRIIAKHAEVSARLEENKAHHDSDDELDKAAAAAPRNRGRRQTLKTANRKSPGRPTTERKDDFFMEDDSDL